VSYAASSLISKYCTDKGNPGQSQGHKATDPRFLFRGPKIAGLPKGGNPKGGAAMNKLILKRVRLTLPVALILLLCGVGGNAQTKWPGEDVLGCGYDVWGKYASQESLKDYCLFDFPDSSTTADDSRASYRDPVPETVFLRHIGKNEAKTVKGNSRKEYAESLAAKAGLSGGTFFFRGSVEGSFGTAQSSTEQEFYFTYMDVIVKWKISLDTRSPEVLRSMMEPRFAIDLEEMAPEDLFATYGTHYVATAYLGGRADFTSLSTFREEAETREIAAAVELRYKAIKGNAEYSSDSERGLRESNTTEKLTVIGGNSEYANDIGDKEQYRLWASGMEEMPVLCDFVGEGSLRPVWELTTDESRKAKLEEVFEQMKKANPLPEKVPITPLVAQSPVEAVLVHPKNNKAYFFKGDKYYRFSFDPDKVEGPFTIGEDGWAGVPSSAALPIQ